LSTTASVASCSITTPRNTNPRRVSIMGKNKDKKKSKKVDAVEPELTDKQRRKLEARAAELEAKLEAERKAEKKAKKKASKKSEPVENATRKPGDGKLGDPLVPESLKVPDDDTVI